MAHFNPNSRIVINRKWFANYFPNLAGVGASVAFINNDSNETQKENVVDMIRVLREDSFDDFAEIGQECRPRGSAPCFLRYVCLRRTYGRRTRSYGYRALHSGGKDEEALAYPHLRYLLRLLARYGLSF